MIQYTSIVLDAVSVMTRAASIHGLSCYLLFDEEDLTFILRRGPYETKVILNMDELYKDHYLGISLTKGVLTIEEFNNSAQLKEE